ncbi:thiaminase II [Bartonella tamiae]|uniref:Aminopyrimidine aminohydrolase n=1 Tax=Bartonella tamiae Th239 TaxID=1094558 RepID=J0R5U1_9HYPH|nr:thiaminase II [Bartonella tamiae]EJF91064.1 hypothetical protein ME5_00396 [Bartonella tamiae Th239]EJF93271.1 hypothetical protein MEG_01485 [Bartonella tamiae Th307]
MRPDFTSGLFGALRRDTGDIWDSYIHHPFVQQLATGKLNPQCFKRFLTQDYLFLIHFSRAYALLAAKSITLVDIKQALSGLKAIADELPLHVAYCAKWGLSEDEMEQEPEAQQTIAYTRYVLDVGHIGDRLDLMAALMPCVAGYAEIGLGLAASEQTVFDNNPYADWIYAYESEEYAQSVQLSIQYMNSLAEKDMSKAQYKRLRTIFNKATQLEIEFWQMGLDAENL